MSMPLDNSRASNQIHNQTRIVFNGIAQNNLDPQRFGRSNPFHTSTPNFQQSDKPSVSVASSNSYHFVTRKNNILYKNVAIEELPHLLKKQKETSLSFIPFSVAQTKIKSTSVKIHPRGSSGKVCENDSPTSRSKSKIIQDPITKNLKINRKVSEDTSSVIERRINFFTSEKGIDAFRNHTFLRRNSKDLNMTISKDEDLDKSQQIQKLEDLIDASALDFENLKEKCLICMVRLPNAVYLPCNHGGFCFSCAQIIIERRPKCHYCRDVIML